MVLNISITFFVDMAYLGKSMRYTVIRLAATVG